MQDISQTQEGGSELDNPKKKRERAQTGHRSITAALTVTKASLVTDSHRMEPLNKGICQRRPGT